MVNEIRMTWGTWNTKFILGHVHTHTADITSTFDNNLGKKKVLSAGIFLCLWVALLDGKLRSIVPHSTVKIDSERQPPRLA